MSFSIWWSDRRVIVDLPVNNRHAEGIETEFAMTKEGVVIFNSETKEKIVSRHGSKSPYFRGDMETRPACFIVDAPTAMDSMRLKRCSIALALIEQQVGLALTVVKERIRLTSAMTLRDGLSITEEDVASIASIHKYFDEADPIKYDVTEEFKRIDKHAQKSEGFRQEAVALIIAHISDIRAYSVESVMVGESIALNGVTWPDMNREQKEKTAAQFASVFLGPLMAIMSSGAEVEDLKK